jgi:hypothetical protein
VSSEVRAYEEQWQQDSGAPEDTKVSVSGRGTEESVVRSQSGGSGGGRLRR